MMGETILVLGGARSGKSRLAEGLAEARGPVVYVATALPDPSDPELTARIARHRERRPSSWTTRELPRGLEDDLPGLLEAGGSVLIDSATLWVSGLMLGLGGPALDDEAIISRVSRAAGAAHHGRSRVVWVSDEVGCGVIPDHPLARRFADLQGEVNQALASACDEVQWCVAGLGVRVK